MLRPGGGGSFRGGSSSSSSGGRSSGGSRSSSSSSSSSGGYRSSSSSGGYYSGGSSGSSGGGSVLGALFVLPVLIFIVIVLVVVFSRKRSPQSWATRAPVMPGPYIPPAPPELSPRKQLQAAADPSFSLVLFDDFVSALFVEIKLAIGAGTLARYQPYVGQDAAAELLGSHPGGAIRNVIVGSATISDVEVDAQRIKVTIDFESNYEVAGRGGKWTTETWTFTRSRAAKSKPPATARMIGCPNCGAPLDVIAAGVCTHCRASVTGGTFDWLVESAEIVGQEERGPMLTSTVAEEGNDEPTVIDPNAGMAFQALTRDDPGTSWQSLSARIGLTFSEFQGAWAGRDLARMRPLMSDALFSTQTYWIEEYKRQHLRNITENARIASLELANVTRDAFYDAVTVRLYASSLDYTMNDQNQIVSGDRSRPRRYTEYWTMIRGRGAKGPPKMEKACPNCGAPLDVTMSGDCKYCKVKVTTGQFDWVLSRIEQDEVYRG